jgi:hypothetical protein
VAIHADKTSAYAFDTPYDQDQSGSDSVEDACQGGRSPYSNALYIGPHSQIG